ncbi:trypsin-like serine protease, partial [Acinetobacter baumannii]
MNGICLPEDTTKDPTGKVTVIGWGHTVENGTVSNILNEVELEIMDRTECDKIFVKFIV